MGLNMKIDKDIFCKTILEILEEGHQVEIKQEKGQILVISVYNKRKVVYKQAIDDELAK